MRKILLFFLCVVLGNPARAQFTPIHTAAVAWNSNVVAIQSTTANTAVHRWAVNSLTVRLNQCGAWQLAYYINPRAGDTMLASLLSLKQVSGLAKNEANSGTFVSGDYTPTTGLTGNGTSKYADTRVNLSTVGNLTNLSLWQSVYTTQALGTTRFVMGVSDGSGRGYAIAHVNSGTMDSGFLGASAVDQYPAGLTNASHTGFLGANSKPFALSCHPTSVHTDTGVPAVQGLAYDGTNVYWIDNAKIIKWNYSNSTQLAVNSTPFAGVTNPLNHLGDGDYYNGYLYVAGQSNGPGPLSDQWYGCILKYDASNLQLSNVFYSSATITAAGGYAPGTSCVAVDPVTGIIYTADYTNASSTSWIDKMDSTTGAWLGRQKINGTIQQVQGIVITNGYMFLSADTPVAAGSGYLKVYMMDLATGTIQKAINNFISGANENEGLTIISNNLVLMERFGSTTNTYAFPIAWNTLATRRSQSYWRNGAPFNVPEISTNTIANVTVFVGAGNNGAAAAFCNRAFGPTIIGQGLDDDTAGKQSRAFMQFDGILGRTYQQ